MVMTCFRARETWMNPDPVHAPFIQQTFIKYLLCGSIELSSAKIMVDKMIDSTPIFKDRLV